MNLKHLSFQSSDIVHCHFSKTIKTFMLLQQNIFQNFLQPRSLTLLAGEKAASLVQVVSPAAAQAALFQAGLCCLYLKKMGVKLFFVESNACGTQPLVILWPLGPWTI